MEQNWTIKKVLDWTSDDFHTRKIPSARLEAELLLAHVLGVERLYLYTHFDRPLHSEELKLFRELVARRRRGECNAHIIGVKEFWSLSFQVTQDVLVPRPDTETLVQAALDRCAADAMVLDMCTGSGCVAISIASERKQAIVHGVDVSEQALQVAGRNVEQHGMSDRVSLFQGDLFSAVPPGQQYDLIVANPPYVRESDLASLAAEVQNEPRLALVGGGDDGLDITRRLLADVRRFVKPGAAVLLELDDVQTRLVAQEIGPKVLGFEGVVICDLAGRHRVVAFDFPA